MRLVNGRSSGFWAQVTYRDNAEAFRRRINGEKFAPPSQADGRLAEIVMKACAYRREDRYSSPKTMRKELESILYEKNEAQAIDSGGDQIGLSEKPDTKRECGNCVEGREDYHEDETIMLRKKDIGNLAKKEKQKLNTSETDDEQAEDFTDEKRSLDLRAGDDKQRTIEQNFSEEGLGEEESHKEKESSNARKRKWMVPVGIAAVLISCVVSVFLTRNPKEGNLLEEAFEEVGVTEDQEITLNEAGITGDMEVSYKESAEQTIETVSEFTDDDIAKFMEEVSDRFSRQAADNWSKVKDQLGEYVEMGSQEVKAYGDDIIIIISDVKYEKRNIAVALVIKKDKKEETPLNLIWE